MAYSDFNLSSVTQAFSLTVNDETALFAEVAELTPSARWQMFLQEAARPARRSVGASQGSLNGKREG